MHVCVHVSVKEAGRKRGERDRKRERCFSVDEEDE